MSIRTAQKGWRPISWREYADRCLDFAGALIEEGHAPGEAVAIMGNNRPEWLIADVGAMVARGVPAGIYQTSSPDQATYIAGHCEAKVLVLENPSYYPRIQQEKLPHLWRIVLMEGMVQDPLAMSFEAFCAMGRAGNLAFMSRTAVSVLGATPADCTVSYLPLAHVAEQMLSIHVPITGGYPVWFAEGLDKLKDALLAARPTIFLGVPRVWEKFHAALSTKLAAATGIKAKIIAWSRATGLRSGVHRLTTGEPGGLRARLADRLFASKLKQQLGLDRLRVALSGAAPIGREVLDFFLSCGVTIHETYGMTESTAVSTFNSPGVGTTRFGTVGRPIEGVDVKLADDGEILMRGPNVFLGYFKDPKATRRVVLDRHAPLIDGMYAEAAPATT
jgi:long-chain acyl-CoA synthetase